MNNKTLLINSGIDLSSWDYKKNNEIGINPSLITSGSGKKHGGYVRIVKQVFCEELPIIKSHIALIVRIVTKE